MNFSNFSPNIHEQFTLPPVERLNKIDLGISVIEQAVGLLEAAANPQPLSKQEMATQKYGQFMSMGVDGTPKVTSVEATNRLNYTNAYTNMRLQKEAEKYIDPAVPRETPLAEVTPGTKSLLDEPVEIDMHQIDAMLDDQKAQTTVNDQPQVVLADANERELQQMIEDERRHMAQEQERGLQAMMAEQQRKDDAEKAYNARLQGFRQQVGDSAITTEGAYEHFAQAADHN